MRIPSIIREPTKWFRPAMIGVAVLILAIGLLDANKPHRTDSYAMGAGALVYPAIPMGYLLFLALYAIKWRPWRVLLAAVATCMCAWLCLAVTWWL